LQNIVNKESPEAHLYNELLSYIFTVRVPGLNKSVFIVQSYKLLALLDIAWILPVKVL